MERFSHRPAAVVRCCGLDHIVLLLLAYEHCYYSKIKLRRRNINLAPWPHFMTMIWY